MGYATNRPEHNFPSQASPLAQIETSEVIWLAEVKEMVIPLRAAWNVPRTKRANRAMAEIRNHVSQHMKIQENEEIWIDQAVNEVIWSRGMQKPPRKIRIVCTREEGFPLEVKLAEE